MTVEGTVKSTGIHVGGICGSIVSSNSLIVNCYSNVKVEGKQYVGGIAGYNFGKIENCKNTGDVSGTSDDVGGITGWGNSNVIQNCYNTGNIIGNNGIGGIIGYVANKEVVKNCYSIGEVAGGEKVGALVGLNDGGTVTNSYYLNKSAVKAINNEDDEANNVQGLSDADMKKAEFVTTLNEGQESGSWKAGNSNYSYPMLTWENYKELTGIEIEKQPTVINYVEGQNFNPEGMKVVAKYSDGTSKEVTDYTVIGGQNLTKDIKSVTISYKEENTTKTVTQKITVEEKKIVSIVITKQPTKITYIEGEDFDPSGMEVSLVYNDATSEKSSNYTIINGTNLQLGTKNVGVSYMTDKISVSTTQRITVVAKELSSIKVTKAPSKVSYKEGENFDKSGMEVTAYYNNGKSAVVTNYLVPDESNLTLGKESVIIRYIENEVTKETTQKISVTHDYEVIVTEPTCTDGGYTTHKCKVCGNEFVDNEKEALGHNYENGVCTRCGSKAPSIEVTSEEYIIDDTYNYVKNIEPKTTVQELIQELTTNATEVRLYKGNQELKATDKVGTNTQVYLKNAYGERTLIVIVKGDTDGDGEANFWDMLAINKHRLGIQLLDDAEIVAGDLDKNGKVDFWDMLAINKYRLGILKKL